MGSTLAIKDRASAEEQISYYLERTHLRFPKELEKAFREDYFDKSVNIVRVSLVMGILLYGVFGFLDVFIAPASKTQIWFIRYAIVCPLLAITLGVSWLPLFRKIIMINLSLVALVAGLGISIMIAISTDTNATRFYYAGLILVLMWSYTFNKLRFVYATVSSWLIVIGYEITAILVQRMLSTTELLAVFINNNFFFISANVLGMAANYLMERYARKDFLHRRLIAEKQKLLELERNTLFERNRLIKIELEMAKRIQQQMMPRHQPDPRIFSMYRPMEEVGGDYYDFIQFENIEKLGIFLSDVSGHGVPAAFITSMIKSSIIQSKQLARDPAKLMKHLNTTLLEQTNDNFITAFYGIFDFTERSFVYTNAGHNPPYVCTGNRVMKLETKAHHVPIAVFDNQRLLQRDSHYRNYRVVLPVRSKLILYTDGLVEVRKGAEDPVFFEDVLEEKILQLREMQPREFVESLYRELVSFRGNESFDDDICLICLQAD